MCSSSKFCGGFPVIHISWNPAPTLPVKWLISMSLLQLFAWILIITSDEITIANHHGFIFDEGRKSTVKWFDSLIGLAGVAAVLSVAYLLKSPTELSARILFAIASTSVILIGFVLHDHLQTMSYPRRMVEALEKAILGIDDDSTPDAIAILQDNETYPYPLMTFLLVLKLFGLFCGLCAAITLLVIMLKLKLKIEVRPRKESEAIDVEDEDRAASEDEHRQTVANGMAALAISVLTIGFVDLLLVSYIDSITLISPESMTHFEKFKILLPLGCVLIASVMWMFHKIPTETRELAVLMSAFLLTIITIQHVVALRLSEVEMRKIDLQDDLVNNKSFCVSKCSMKFNPNGGLICKDDTLESVCIDSHLYCDGNIDLRNNFGNGSSEIFVNKKNLSETDNMTFTLKDVLLYPDEIYCSWRVHATFMLCYMMSFLSFCAAIAVLVRTRPLIHFLIRRRAKELAKKKLREQNIPYDRVTEPP